MVQEILVTQALQEMQVTQAAEATQVIAVPVEGVEMETQVITDKGTPAEAEEAAEAEVALPLANPAVLVKVQVDQVVVVDLRTPVDRMEALVVEAMPIMEMLEV